MIESKPLVLSVLLAVAVIQSEPALAYVYNGLVWPDDMIPVPYYIGQEGCDDLGLDKTIELVQKAVETWTSVKCTKFDMEFEGLTDKKLQLDQYNVIVWYNKEWYWGKFALAVTSYLPLKDHPTCDIAFNSVNFVWQEGADPLTIENGKVVLTGKADPLPVLVHELGHFIGLSHTKQDNAATMYEGYLPGGVQATLSADDKLAICRLYPSGQDECITDSDCPQDYKCIDYGDVAVCAEPHDDWGDYCGIDYINCKGICAMGLTGQGYCTHECNNDSDCIEGWVCFQSITSTGMTIGLCVPTQSPQYTELADILIYTPGDLGVIEVYSSDTVSIEPVSAQDLASNHDIFELRAENPELILAANDTKTFEILEPLPQKARKSSSCSLLLIERNPTSVPFILLIVLLAALLWLCRMAKHRPYLKRNSEWRQ